jgi:hypothetical protein
MGEKEVTFEDLLDDDGACAAPPLTFEQVLACGFPYRGGLAALTAITQIEDPGPRLATVRQAYLQILSLQKRASR